MTFDLSKESLIPLGKLARRLPPSRNGRPVHTSTPHRWRRPGLRGVQLEAIRVGGTWMTSWEAFHRFCAALAAQADGAASKDVPESDSDKELEVEGW